MKYQLKNPMDCQKFKQRVNELYGSGCVVELKKINPNRTLSQNKYLHVILGYFALEFGDSLEYVKEMFFKQVVNREIFEVEIANRKTGEIRKGLRSTSELDTKELTLAIDRFRDYASKEAGIYLPQPNEKEYLMQIQIEMEKAEQYL